MVIKSVTALITGTLCAVTVGLPAVDYVLPRNQTKKREAYLDIRSIAADVASPMTRTQPGTSVRGNGTLSILYDNERLYREEVVPAANRDEGTQHTLAARLRLRITGSWSTEVAVRGIIAKAYDGADISTLDSLAIYQLYDQRYRGANLVMGLGWPVGRGKPLSEGHSVDEVRPDAVVGLRMTEHAYFNVFHLNINGRYGDSIVYVTDRDRPVDDGPGILEGEWVGDRLRLNASFGWTWRPIWWYRVGAEAEATMDWLYGVKGSENQELRDRRFRIELFQEFTWSPNASFVAAVGVDPDTLKELEEHAILGSAGLVLRF
jgi:hypothetical protein